MDGARDSAIGVIGGSGVYDIDGLEAPRWQRVESPFGEASDELCIGTLAGHKMVFLPRHGRGHRIPPSAVNYRANIDILKRAGVTEIVSISAVGSLDAEIAPGTFVIVDQFIDRTIMREKSFFGHGLVAHVSMAQPVCGRMSAVLAKTAAKLDIPVVSGGTYLAMEGPQFSSRAESELYRGWGCQVIGMTNMPEAKLAREAEICYVTIAMVTDYDCWHPDHDAVTVESIIEVMNDNGAKARRLVAAAVTGLDESSGGNCVHGCQTALDSAVITAPDSRDPAMVAKLDAVAGRVLRG